MKSLVVFQLAGKLLDHRQKNHLDRLHATWINSGNEPNKWEFRFLLTSLFASARWAQDWSNVLPHQSNKMFSTYGILIPSNKLGTKTPTNTHKRKINAKKTCLPKNIYCSCRTTARPDLLPLLMLKDLRPRPNEPPGVGSWNYSSMIDSNGVWFPPQKIVPPPQKKKNMTGWKIHNGHVLKDHVSFQGG